MCLARPCITGGLRVALAVDVDSSGNVINCVTIQKFKGMTT